VCVLVLLALTLLLGVFIYRKRYLAQVRGNHESVPSVAFDALQQHIDKGNYHVNVLSHTTTNNLVHVGMLSLFS